MCNAWNWRLPITGNIRGLLRGQVEVVGAFLLSRTGNRWYERRWLQQYGQYIEKGQFLQFDIGIYGQIRWNRLSVGWQQTIGMAHIAIATVGHKAKSLLLIH